MTLRLHYALRSDVGHVREGNEDSAYAGSRLIAVADGMGGHAAGEVASSTVIALLARLDEDVPSGSLPDALASAVRDANAELRDMTAHDGSLDGMGTTVTAVLASGSRLGVLHVGDSRAYLLRDDTMVQITHDHTLVQDLVDQGRITPDQAGSHPQRSLLMRALDGREVEPDVSVREAHAGDRYLLCTDGLSSVVSDETILDALLLPTPQEATDRLVDLALKGGGPDNVTVVVADVVADEPGYGDHPMVAGAAAEKGVVAGALSAADNAPTGELDTSAARAASIRRQQASGFHDGQGDYDTGYGDARYGEDFDSDNTRVGGRAGHEGRGGGGSDRSRSGGGRRRFVVVAGVVVIILVAGAAAGWAYVRTQYYVGVDQDQVTLFRGVDSKLGFVSLSHPQKHYMPLSQIADFARQQVRDGIPADSRADAERRINELPGAEPTAGSKPSPTPTPTVGSTAGTTGGKTPAKAPCPTAANAARPPGCVPATTR